MKVACRYAIVQFVPYSETGEFANIGVVLVCPTTAFFGFQLQIRKHGRVTAFFDEIGGSHYRNAVREFEAELVRLRHIVARAPKHLRADQVRALFLQLVVPRETIIRFGPERPILTDDPQRALEELFDHYVDRAFATAEYVEETIGRRLKTLLGHLQLPHPFKPERIGNDEIFANFPLVQRVQGVASKAIKPFNLSQNEPNAIYDHGGTWLDKLKRLRQRDLLPPKVMFAVEAPPEYDEKRWRAYNEIRGELLEQSVEVVPAGEEPRIVEFARR